MKSLVQHTCTIAIALCSQTAFADCYIYTNFCRPETGIAPNSFFKDSDPNLVIQNDPNRCAQRAREYLNYCAAPADSGVAVSYYYSAGAWKSAVVVTLKSSQSYVADFKQTWVPVQKDY